MSNYNLLIQKILNSGDSVVFDNFPGATHFTMNLTIAGAPVTCTINIYGTLAGVDTLIESYTANANELDEHQVDPTVYDSFKVTASWTGGAGVSVTIDTTLIVDDTTPPVSKADNPFLFPITIPLHGDYNFLHGLGAIPQKVVIAPTSDAMVRFQLTPFPPWDDTYIYLNASADSVEAILVIEL